MRGGVQAAPAACQLPSVLPRPCFTAGLPEELRIRAITLRRRLAFVALSSLDRHTGCWDAEGDAGLAAAVAELLAAHGLSGKPLYVFGASSGGAMALLLPRHAAALPAPLPVSGVVSEIMAVGLEYLDKLPGGGAYPPTAFVHMPRDADTAARVAEAVGALSEAGTPVAEVQIKPRAVTPEFLAGRSAALRKRGGAARVVRALLKGDMLDGHGYQQRDPRGGQWRAVVHEAVTSVATAADSSDLSGAATPGASAPSTAARAWPAARRRADQGNHVLPPYLQSCSTWRTPGTRLCPTI